METGALGGFEHSLYEDLVAHFHALTVIHRLGYFNPFLVA